MAINPIVYTERVVRSFLKYQLSAYPFADPRLHTQMRDLLRLDRVRSTPLLRGPYISLSRGFREGASIEQLIDDRVFHPHMRQIIPAGFTNVYGHQERAIRAIHAGQTTLVSTGTGSGKTECFLYPIISKCLQLKDAGAESGIVAVIVYPMNALAEDQLDRLRGLLAGSGISFGMYVGKTPENEHEVTGHRMPAGTSRADYEAVLTNYRDAGRPDAVHPLEEVCSRQQMRTSGSQPRILLTNVKQLELLLTRQVDVDLFSGARLEFLVFDEAHTFTGSSGAETACLIRRLRRFCGREAHETTCVATSATIVDEKDPDAARNFASRFFGVPDEAVATVHEEYQEDRWSPKHLPPTPELPPNLLLEQTLAAVDSPDPFEPISDLYRRLTGRPLPDGPWRESLFDELRENEVAAQIHVSLRRPRELYLLLGELEKTVGRTVSEEELLAYLTLGAASLKNGRPLLRPVVHGFVRGISGAVVTFPKDNEPKLWLSSEEELKRQPEQIWRPRVFTCTTCGQHYYTGFLKDFQFTKSKPEGGQLADGGSPYWEALDKVNGGNRVVLVDQIISQEDDDDLEEADRLSALYFCRYCGSAAPDEFGRCFGCGATSPPVKLFVVRETGKQPGQLSSCLSCGARGKRLGRRYREPIREVRAVNVSDVHVLAQDMVHHAQRKRLLVFADNRQDAAFQAGWMKDHARRFRLRSLMADAMQDGAVTIGDMTLKISQTLDENDTLSRVLIPEVWRAVPKEGTGGMHEDERLHFLRIQVLREVTMAANQQIGLEPWGRLKVTYRGLDPAARFVQTWSNRLGIPPEDMHAGIEALLDHLRRRRLLHDSRREIFSRFWNDGDREIQRGYMPVLPGPQGMKLTASATDDKARVFQWLGQRNTLVRQVAKKWGVPADDIPGFLEELWQYLTSSTVGLLTPVTLKGSKDRPLPNCSGVYQIDSAKLLLRENHGYYRCRRCRRKIMRRTPGNKCLAWLCEGDLEFISEDPDNYNLQLLDDCIIYHSYPWLRSDRNDRTGVVTLQEGETDFVIVSPKFGLLILEVKGGQIDYDPADRLWYRWVGSGDRKEIRDPFEQVRRNAHFLENLIRAEVFPRAPQIPCPYGYAVVFPDCEYKGSAPPGADTSVILSASDVCRLGDRVLQILGKWRRADKPVVLSKRDMDGVMKALSPVFKLLPVLFRQIEEQEERLFRLTEEQIRVLDILTLHQRAAIRGVAGSGKTLLARSQAQRFADDGKQTLFVCFNKALAEWLRASMPECYENLITVRHFHGLCSDWCRRAKIPFLPEGDQFWKYKAPDLLTEAIDRLSARFDAVVVDEGQDFYADWWLPLELINRQGEAGPFYVFFDPAQNLFVEDDLSTPDLGTPFELPTNCRNTKRIAEVCGKIRGISIKTKSDAPEGAECVIELAETPDTQRRLCHQLISDWVGKGKLRPSQVAILCPHEKSRSSLANVDSIGKVPITQDPLKWEANGSVLFATVRSFKGLEADAVIMTDVVKADSLPHFTTPDFYVGCSRAKHLLAVLACEVGVP